MGEVEITVSADSSVWSINECVDTSDSYVSISVSLALDEYTINIQTNDAEYIGHYSVMEY